MTAERTEQRPLAQGGLYEVWCGVRDVAAAARYWSAFGYDIEAEADLGAGLAAELYGHRSAARSVRLRGSADHGLVRLLQWNDPTGAGLGTSGLNAAGTRWVGHFTKSVMNVANHAAAAKAAGMAIEFGDVHFINMGKAYAHLFDGREPQPFVDPLIALREIQLFSAEVRQVVLERFGYDSPLLGTFADDSLLQTTQVVQGCLVVKSNDPAIFDFYTDVLGLWKSLELTIPYEQAQASRAIFALREGETHYNVDLDEPRSKPGLAERRSGRLKCFRFENEHQMPNVHDIASPGSLGMCNYSWKVADIAEARARATRAGASQITSILNDEFGCEAFSCRAPDGYFWTFMAAERAAA